MLGPVLVLGGTAEARKVADVLHHAGLLVVSSLAGRIADLRVPAGEIRIGGFGGPAGLADWLRQQQCVAVIDGTHPFADQISASAASACESSGVPLMRLQRPGWTEEPADRWHWVDDIETAAEITPRLGKRILLTVGRQRLDAFAESSDAWFLLRCVDPPERLLPFQHELLLARGPFTIEGELDVIQRHRIDLIVTRDSGGAATEAKLLAARERALPVVMIRRPRGPDVLTVACAEEAIAWAQAVAVGR